MANQNELQRRIEQLEATLARLTGRQPVQSDDPKDKPDYVERGSDRHAAMMGLKKAVDGEEIAIDGWTFEDVTQYGPQATKDYLMTALRQKVNELTSTIPPTQSTDPLARNFAPVMWQPKIPLSQITEN